MLRLLTGGIDRVEHVRRVEELSERGIERRHTSLEERALTSQDLVDTDLIIALCEVGHRPMIEEAHAAWADQVIYWNVPDLPDWSPDHALSEIECQVLLLLNLLVGRTLSAIPFGFSVPAEEKPQMIPPPRECRTV